MTTLILEARKDRGQVVSALCEAYGFDPMKVHTLVLVGGSVYAWQFAHHQGSPYLVSLGKIAQMPVERAERVYPTSGDNQ